VKHALYRQYLRKWLPILLNGFGGRDITYAEGFAGPGIYLGGEPGSPVIAMRTLIEDPKWRTQVKNVRFLFVDKDPRCTALLGKRIAAAVAPVDVSDLASWGIDVEIRTGNCDPTLAAMLDAHSAWGHPMLVVLDTFGGGVPRTLIERIAQNKGGEVLVTIKPDYFLRFAETEHEHGDRVFGSRDWRAVASLKPAEKQSWVLEHYRDTLSDAGFRFVLDFELIDARGKALYLIFGSNHERGLEKMKEAMWEVDDVRGFGYRDPRDPDQEILEIEFEPQTHALKRLIVAHLLSLPGCEASVHDLRDYAFFRTVFKRSQVQPVLEELLARGQLELLGPAPLHLSGRVRIVAPSLGGTSPPQ
jgi:three-Cys-motif partner protein